MKQNVLFFGKRCKDIQIEMLESKLLGVQDNSQDGLKRKHQQIVSKFSVRLHNLVDLKFLLMMFKAVHGTLPADVLKSSAISNNSAEHRRKLHT